MMPGLYYDGYELYLEEEHVAWKSEMAHEAKVAIAKRAAAMIKNHMAVYIDAGSTTAELVKIICNRIQSNNLHTLTVVTISISHANAIAECCMSKGFDDTNSNIKLEFLGGTLRPNTEATVPKSESERMSDIYESFDIAFVGANGVTEKSLTVLPNSEYKRKKEALALGTRKVVLCDASKSGVSLAGELIRADEDFTLIINNDQTNETFKSVVGAYENKVKLA
jgi:DeoR family fructose operon transcriptional repressor